MSHVDALVQAGNLGAQEIGLLDSSLEETETENYVFFSYLPPPHICHDASNGGVPPSPYDSH